jgi:hypothetical protein
MPPVDDHAVHEKVKIKADKPYGCKNHSSSAGYYAPDRVYKPDGTFYIVQVFIPHVMTTDCRYDMSRLDPRCNGCSYKESDGC